MRVLIIGSGIAGLALATHFQKMNVEFTIIDKTTKWEQEGFAIGLWSLGLKTLEEFNIYTLIKKYSNYPSHIVIRNKGGRILKNVDCRSVFKQCGPAVLILRSDLHKILLHLNKKSNILLNTKVISMNQQKDSVVVRFSNGRKETFDLVVGADGINSETRKFLFKENGTKELGITSFICAVDKIQTPTNEVTEIWGKQTFFGYFPLLKNKACVFFALPTRDLKSKSGIDAILDHFRKFGWVVPSVLSDVKNSRNMYKSRWQDISLETWCKGRVVLMGDAAHGMIPALGMGASMALEDAYVLADELKHGDIDLALQNYMIKRKKRVTHIKRYVTFVGSFIELKSSLLVIFRDFILGKIPTLVIQNRFFALLSSNHS
jgi:FAD-dependent urate hydroxylase